MVRVRGVHVGEYPALEDVDAVMITGSRESLFFSSFFFIFSSPPFVLAARAHNRGGEEWEIWKKGGEWKERKSERNEKKEEKAKIKNIYIYIYLYTADSTHWEASRIQCV